MPTPMISNGIGSGGGQTNPLAASQGGYNAALGSLNKSLNSLQGSDSSQLMQAQQQLQQSQGKVQQGAINAGLGNTTVAQNLQQAPLQTYNQNVAGIQNNLAKDQSAVFGQGAQLQAQGGNQMAQLLMGLQQQQLAATAQQDQYSNTFAGAKKAMPGGLPGAAG